MTNQITLPREVIEQLVEALTIGIAKHWGLATDVRIGDALTAGREALAGSERVEPVPTRIERKVYKGSAEYPEYLSARFTKDKQAGSFEWQGHRWAYHWTSFDDAGDFDLIYRNTPPKETP